MAAIFLFSILRQISLHDINVECHKEHSSENQIVIYIFVNKICLIYAWRPSWIFDQHEYQLGPTRHKGGFVCEVSELWHK